MKTALQDLKDVMSKSLYRIIVEEAQKEGLCIQCKEPALPKCYSDAGIKEYHISGLCELCLDEIIKE